MSLRPDRQPALLRGHAPDLDGKLTHAGQVGREQTVQTGAKAAEACALNTLANIKASLGSLEGSPGSSL